VEQFLLLIRGAIFRPESMAIKPEWGELNHGALAGLLVGVFGGMFAIQLPGVVEHGNLMNLLTAPKLTIVGGVAGGLAGWFLGGQAGPYLRTSLHNRKAEFLGGALGGMVVVFVLLLAGFLNR
jgi:hypothetical protein